MYPAMNQVETKGPVQNHHFLIHAVLQLLWKCCNKPQLLRTLEQPYSHAYSFLSLSASPAPPTSSEKGWLEGGGGEIPIRVLDLPCQPPKVSLASKASLITLVQGIVEAVVVDPVITLPDSMASPLWLHKILFICHPFFHLSADPSCK